MKIVIRKTEYPRKAPGFSVLVTDENGATVFVAHPQTYECVAQVVAAAMELLVATPDGRGRVLAAAEELG